MPPLDPQAQQVLNQRNGVQAPAQPQQAQPRPVQPQQRGPVFGPPVVQQAPLPNPVSEATEDRNREQNTFRTMTAEEAAAAGLREGGVYQVNGLGEIKTINEAPTIRPQIANPDRVPQLESILGLIGQLRTESGDMLAVGRTSRGVSETPIIGALLGQNRANVEGYLQTIQGDLIQQQMARLVQMNGGNGASSMANSETEAARMAASIANLDPNQEYDQFLTGVQRAEDYYQREYERLTGRRYSADGQQDQQAAMGGTTGGSGSVPLTNGDGSNEPDPNGGTDEYGTPLRLMNGEVFREYVRGPDGGLVPTYGPPTPTRDGISALILGDGTRSIGQQLGAGVGDIVQGAGDVVGILGNPLNQGINAVFGTNLSTDLGQSARDLSGLPDNPNQLQSAINRGATAAMTFGGLARGGATLAENVTTRGVLNTIGQTPIRDAAAGASAGAGAYAARDAGPIGQTGAALAAGMLGYGAAGLAPGMRAATSGAPVANATRRGAQDVIATGEREGVRVMTSDVAPPQNFVTRSVRALGERIPVAGTGGPRAAQQAEREAAVRSVAEEYGVTGNDDFVAAVTNDLVRTRGDRLSRLSDRKNRIIDGVSAPVQPLALRRTLREIDQQIATLERTNPSQMAPVVRNLQTFREALQASPSLRQVEENRRLLGDMFADPSLANVKGLGEKAVRAIYGPLREDMIDFVRSEAGDQAARSLQETNERLASMVGELDARNFSRVLRQADTTPEAVANLLFSRNDSDVRRLVENLSPSGRRQAQSAVIFRAIDSAGDLNAVAGLSPQRFASQIERYSDNIGIVFEPEDAARLQGLQRLLQATQRASEASALPPTGVQNSLPILTAVLADAMGGAGAGLTTAGMAGVAARIYESQAARNMLVGLSRSQPGSRREARTLEGLARLMASQPGIREAFTRAANDNAALPANIAASPQDDER